MTNDPEKKALQERIDRLERRVEYLEDQLNASENQSGDTYVVKQEEFESSVEENKKDILQRLDFGESWLNKIGIGLLLLGVAFLFKFSIDQGWLVPPVRSLIGLIIGLILFTWGLQIKERGTLMKQILLGGGIGVFYITGFATYQLYNFISYPVVWIFMIVVTLLALSLSLQQNNALLSVIGILGGLGTPFMLYSGSGSLTGLMVYTSIVLAGAGTIYFYRGWLSLLWTMVVGGWLVMLVGLFNNILWNTNVATADQWSLQAGIMICLLLFWIMPVFREILVLRDPARWKSDFSDEDDRDKAAGTPSRTDPNVRVMAFLVPLATLFFSMGIWEISWELWGAVALVGALVTGFIYLPLRSEGVDRMASIHGFTGLVLLTTGFFLLLEGDLLFITLALEALGLRIIVSQTSDENLAMASHILFGVLGAWLLERLLNVRVNEIVLVNLDALTELLVIGTAGLVVPQFIQNTQTKRIYRIGAHVAFLGWFLSEFSMLENGQAYVSIAWGGYSILLVIIGFITSRNWIRIMGMATILILVIKLFLIDLSQLEAIWRILLFIGFGALFLIMGYFLEKKWSVLFEKKSTDD